MRHGRVRQRQPQQAGVAKFVPELVLQRFGFGHGRKD
jgi:hypothetical protein